MGPRHDPSHSPLPYIHPLHFSALHTSPFTPFSPTCSPLAGCRGSCRLSSQTNDHLSLQMDWINSPPLTQLLIFCVFLDFQMWLLFTWFVHCIHGQVTHVFVRTKQVQKKVMTRNQGKIRTAPWINEHIPKTGVLHEPQQKNKDPTNTTLQQGNTGENDQRQGGKTRRGTDIK